MAEETRSPVPSRAKPPLQQTACVAIVLVGSDAAGLGKLASRLRDQHGARVGVFVGNPTDDDLPVDIVTMANELYGDRANS